jgi:hypothetical protein
MRLLPIPPTDNYGLEFMGRDWDSFRDRDEGDFGSGYTEKPRWGGRPESTDRRGQMNVPNFYVAGRAYQDWCMTWVPEALRVLRPGGHIVAFGGTRTFHRLACALEDGGFEIRDALADLTGIDGPGLLWMYGQGFPKSLNVSKAIDRHLGAEREVISEGKPLRRMIPGADQDKTGSWIKDNGREFAPTVTEAATSEASQWEGWGTALKPSWEPIILARKPIERSVAYNVMKWGTGALNVDGCRLEGTGSGFDSLAGRWPPNAILGEQAAEEMDRQSGIRPAGSPLTGNEPGVWLGGNGIYGGAKTPRIPFAGYGDTGGASRFYPVFRYEAKATASERPKDGDTLHPTVKPVGLMDWLVRLVTPPGGTVLDPFAGSGTTGEACIISHFSAILIEKDESYCKLIGKRLTKPIQSGLF